MKFAIIYSITIYKDDIVKIKFKKLEDILETIKKNKEVSLRDAMGLYGLETHLQAIVSGGVFKVTDTCGEKDSKRYADRRKYTTANVPPDLHEIIIEDHITGGEYWYLNEDMIESIEVVQADEVYFSEIHQLSLMKIDGALYINGELLSKNDKKILHMFEQCLSDSVIKNLLDVNFNNEEYEED
jgi:hypothetical protein